MIFLTQRSNDEEIIRQMPDRSTARRVLREIVGSLRRTRHEVWGSIKDGYQALVDGEYITIEIVEC